MSNAYVGGGSGGGGGGTITSVTTSNATPQFVLTGTVENVDFGLTNLLVGSSGIHIAGAQFNSGFGDAALIALTSGIENSCFGTSSGDKITTGSSNSFFGYACGIGITTASGNCGLGQSVFANVNGSGNIGIGIQTGDAYTSTESNNILIQNLGVISESNVMRIGTQGSGTLQVNTTYIAGIVGVTTSNSQMVTIDSTSGHMGVAAIPGGSQPNFSVVLNSASSNFASGSGPNTIVYDTVLIDTASGYASGVYTIPAGGTGNWFISSCFLAATSVSFTVCDLFLNKNSGTYILHLTPDATTDGVVAVNGSGSGLFPLVAGDTIQWQVFATTTGAATYSMNGASNGFFNIWSGFKLS